MKIIFIGQKGIGEVLGGVEKHVEALSLNFAKKGHEVVVYAKKHLFNKKIKNFHGVKLIYLNTIKSKHLDTIIHTFFTIVHVFVFQKKVDIIHFHSIGPSALLWLMKILKPKTKLIVTMHAKCYEHSKWGAFATTYLKLSEFLCCKIATDIIVISKELKIYTKEKYGNDVKYIPNGAKELSERNSVEILHKLNIKEGEYFLFVGRLIPGKKVDILIEAYKILNTEKKLVIVGEISYTDKYLTLLYKLSNESKNIVFAGFRNSQEISNLMKNAFIFIFPSESEGMSLVLLEAMASKLPILATNIVGNRSLLNKDLCTFFEVNDMDSLLKAMEYSLYNYDEIKRKSDLAYDEFTHKYSWDKISDITFNYYKMKLEDNHKKTSFLHKLFLHDKWNIGIAKISTKSIISNFKISDKDMVWMPEEHGYYFADSFLYEYNGQTWLFYEKFTYNTNSAGLSVVEILNNNGEISYGESIDILKSKFHQSYPYVFEEDGSIYIIPEQSESGNVVLYEAINFPSEWKESKILLKNFSGVDATPFKYDNMWWMFVSELGDNENKQLELYYANELKGEWRKHKFSPILNTRKGARMAGNIVNDNGILYRFGQDCSETYGGGIVVFEIEELTVNNYKEKKIGEIKSFGKYSKGFHTIGSISNNQSIVAIDAKRWAGPVEVIVKMMAIIKNKFKN